MIYTHVLNQGGRGVRSPLNGLFALETAEPDTPWVTEASVMLSSSAYPDFSPSSFDDNSLSRGISTDN